MNFEEILQHHLFDHVYFPLVKIGSVTLPFSKHVLVMWIVSIVTVGVLSFAARARSGAGLVLRTGVEALVVYIRDHILEPIFGHATRFYLPYFLTLFFFIWFCNM